MKYYIIAGEASGDTYGAELMASIKATDHTAEFRFWGGEKMRAHSDNQAMDYKQTAFMGFWEVIKNISKIKGLLIYCKDDILDFNPDRIIFIDYPGFNLRIAAWARKNNFRTAYFVAPQLWAWKKNRYKKIARDIDQLFVILPFEKGFYKGLGIESHYFGHPLEALIQQKDRENFSQAKSLNIAILPGSRIQELEKHLPVFKALIKSRTQDQFHLAIAPGLEKSDIEQILKEKLPNLKYGSDTKEMVRKADLALVKSGTSTLETALIGTPQIVIYKTSALSFAIGKRVVKLPFISLVNIIAGKKIVSELIQNDFNLENINTEIQNLQVPANREKMISAYQELRTNLKGDQVFQKVAQKILAKNIR